MEQSGEVVVWDIVDAGGELAGPAGLLPDDGRRRSGPQLRVVADVPHRLGIPGDSAGGPAFGQRLAGVIAAAPAPQGGGILIDGGDQVLLRVGHAHGSLAGVVLCLRQRPGFLQVGFHQGTCLGIPALIVLHGGLIQGTQFLQPLGILIGPLQGGLLARQDGSQGLLGVAVRQVLQGSPAGSDGLVGLLQRRPQLAAIGLDLLGDAFAAFFVVGFAHGGVDVGHHVAQVVHQGVIGAGQLLRQAAVGLVDVVQNGLGRGTAGDVSVGHHLSDAALVGTGGVRQCLVDIHAPLAEIVEVFLRGLPGGPHSGKTTDKHIDVGAVEVQASRGVGQGHEHTQRLIGSVAVQQQLGVPGNLVIGIVGGSGHLPHLLQIGVRGLIAAQALGKGHLGLLPAAGHRGARRETGVRDAAGVLVKAGIPALVGIILLLIDLCAAGQQADAAADGRAHSCTDAGCDHGSHGRAAGSSGQCAGEHRPGGGPQRGANQGVCPLADRLACHIDGAGLPQLCQHRSGAGETAGTSVSAAPRPVLQTGEIPL